MIYILSFQKNNNFSKEVFKLFILDQNIFKLYIFFLFKKNTE